MQKIVNGVKIECVQGDIASQGDIAAVVNAANAQLRMGGGVAGAINRAAGAELEQECRPLAPIKLGQAVLTGGHKLPNRYIIHCLGPVYGRDKPEDKLLADCYRNALLLAEKHKIESIAFPAISAGAFGYPVEDAASVAFGAILEMTDKLKYIKIVRFVLYSRGDLEAHQNVLSALATNTDK